MIIRLLCSVALMMALSGVGRAQDLHYSQFYHAPLTINPALAGIFNGDGRLIANFRNQWSNVPVDYLTFSGSYDRRFYLSRKSSNFLNAGLQLNFDRAGDNALQMAQLGLNLGYTIAANENFFLTPAVVIGFAQRTFDASTVEFFAPEASQFDSRTLVDIGAGVNARIQQSERTHFDLGVGLFHINQPNTSFEFVPTTDSLIRAPINRRLSLYGMGGFELTDNADLKLRGLGQFQVENEILLGAGVKFYISKKRGKQTAFEVAGSYRLGDAVYPNFTFYYNDFLVGLSYDINLSDFEVATSNRGGPEIAVQYIIKHVKPLRRFKACPIF